VDYRKTIKFTNNQQTSEKYDLSIATFPSLNRYALVPKKIVLYEKENL